MNNVSNPFWSSDSNKKNEASPNSQIIGNEIKKMIL
jgi:hypothetical protein